MNSRFRESIKTIQQLDVGRISVLLTRICANSDMSQSSSILTEKEKEKLLERFEISSEQYERLIQGLYFMVLDSACERDFRPYQDLLTAEGVEAEMVEAIRNCINENMGPITEKLKSKAVACSSLLKDVSWEMNIPIAESSLPLKQELSAAHKLNFKYSKDARNPCSEITFQMAQETGGPATEMFTLRAEKSGVQEIFETIENIQDDLDSLLS